MKYILAIVIFGIIILIHEFGHYFTAKLCGIKVNKFALGLGPRLLKKQWGETEYSLRLFPVGGFCEMEGENEDCESNRAFSKKPVWQRMIVIVAGAAMNILLGFVLIIILTCMCSSIPTTVIDSFHTASPESTEYTAESYDGGLCVGDRVVEMNGINMLTIKDLQYALISSEGKNCDVTVERGGEKITLENINFKDKTTGGMIDFYVKAERKNLFNVISYSARDTVSTVKLIWFSLKDLVTGKYGFNEMSGPVGLVSAMGEAAHSGNNIKESVMSTLNLSSMITVNLGVLNLLPVPSLDGGRFMFLLVEAIRRKPIKPEHEGMVHFIGMALLMLMIVVVTFGDIKRLIG